MFARQPFGFLPHPKRGHLMWTGLMWIFRAPAKKQKICTCRPSRDNIAPEVIQFSQAIYSLGRKFFVVRRNFFPGRGNNIRTQFLRIESLIARENHRRGLA
jgi:hypothetical protein